MDRHSGWPWEVVEKCGFFAVLRAQPAKGEVLNETTYGDPVPGRPQFVHTYTVACCLRGEVKATWGNGSTSWFNGFTYGPNRSEEDPTIIPEGNVRYEALSGNVDFVCLAPRRGGAVDQEAYHGPAEVPGKADSYIVVLRGSVEIEGTTYGRLQAYHNKEGNNVSVNSSPQAFYVNVWKRGA